MIVCLLLTALCLADDDCTFSAGDIKKYAEVVECLNKAKLDTSMKESEKTLSTVKTLLESYTGYGYVYEGTTDNPDPYDLLHEINNIHTDGSTTVEYFYSQIQEVLRKANDRSLYITKPCGSAFTFLLPFAFTATDHEGEGAAQIRLAKLPSKYAAVTAQYESDYEADRRPNNLDIVYQIDDGGDKARADKFISDWAETNIYHSRDKASSFNIAVRKEFAIRSMARHSIPNSNLTIYVKNNNEGTLEYDLPFYVYVEKDVPSMEELCGLKSASSQQVSLQSSLRSNQKKIFNSTKSEKRSRASSSKSHPNDIEFDPILTAKGFAFYQANNTELPTAYLKLTSFAENVNITSYVNVFLDGLLEVKNRNLQYLIVDLRDNDGVNPSLALGLLEYLQPTVFPLNPTLQMRISDLYTELNDKDLLNNLPLYYPLSTDSVTKTFYKDTVTRTFTDSAGTIKLKFSSKFYRRITESEKDDEAAILKLQKEDDHVTFDPQHLLFLTDGTCYGSCAIMLDRIVIGHIAPVVFLGKRIVDSAQDWDNVTNYNVASSPFAAYHTTEWLDEIKAKNPKIKFSEMPEPFLRKDVVMGWTSEEPFTYDLKNMNATLSFTGYHPDYVLHFWPENYQSDMTSVADLIMHLEGEEYFKKCLSWQVQESSDCASKVPSGSHEIYGHPCSSNGKTYDTSQCVFARCERGYYRNKDDVCVAVPLLIRASSHYLWLIPLSIVFFIAFFALAFVLAYGLWKNRTERTRYVPIVNNSINGDGFVDLK